MKRCFLHALQTVGVGGWKGHKWHREKSISESRTEAVARGNKTIQLEREWRLDWSKYYKDGEKGREKTEVKQRVVYFQ